VLLCWLSLTINTHANLLDHLTGWQPFCTKACCIVLGCGDRPETVRKACDQGPVCTARLPTHLLLSRTGLHGAAVAITGRRENVLRDAVATLEQEGIRAHGIQAGSLASRII